jgi:hypothetical protein
MKVEIEISDKVFNLAVAQCLALVDSDEEQCINEAKERCKDMTVEIDIDELPYKIETQLGFAMLGIAKVAREIEKSKQQ